MKKSIVAAAILGMSCTVSGHSSVCTYSTDFNIEINQESVLFKKQQGEVFEFKGNSLLINNEVMELTEKQQAASKNFQREAREMVPKIAEIAVEGAELGVKAATIAINALFADSPDAKNELIKPIEAISDKIKQNISKTQLNTQTLEASLEDAFDKEFEKMIETAVSRYSGRIIGSVLGSIFSGDGEELKDLEFRMENLEQDIDDYVEVNAKKIEQKADALCDDMIALDRFDNQLQDLSGYPDGGLIQKGEKSSASNSISLSH